MLEAIRLLYTQGGIGRFYQGLIPALCMMPLSKFGDIFSNGLAQEFFSESFPAAVVTLMAATLASTWKLLIMPADTVKTMMQVHGADGLTLLQSKVSTLGLSVLYDGALIASAATWVDYYPWFITHNFLVAYCVQNQILDAHLKTQNPMRKNIRRALMGLISSLVSDVFSNVFYVLKTFTQTSLEPIGSLEAAARIIEKDGLMGLLFRGMTLKLTANALNAMLFAVVWMAIVDRQAKQKQDSTKKAE